MSKISILFLVVGLFIGIIAGNGFAYHVETSSVQKSLDIFRASLNNIEAKIGGSNPCQTLDLTSLLSEIKGAHLHLTGIETLIKHNKTTGGK